MRRYNEAKRERRPAAITGFTPSQKGKRVLVSCNMEREDDKTEVFFVLVIDVDVKILILVIYR